MLCSDLAPCQMNISHSNPDSNPNLESTETMFNYNYPLPPKDLSLTVHQMMEIKSHLEQLGTWVSMKNPKQDLGLRIIQSLFKSPNFYNEVKDFLFNGLPFNSHQKQHLEFMQEALLVPLAELPDFEFPSWPDGKVFIGVRRPKTLDLSSLYQTSQIYEDQNPITIPGQMVMERDLSANLVRGYKFDDDNPNRVYYVAPDDGIHCGYGKEVLPYLKQNRRNLPERLLLWAKGKLLCALPDSVRNNETGGISIPCCFLDDDSSQPIRWLNVGAGGRNLGATIAILAAARP